MQTSVIRNSYNLDKIHITIDVESRIILYLIAVKIPGHELKFTTLLQDPKKP